MLKTILKPKVTVEQIHAEFDSAQDRILSECDRLLNELKIPTENQLERKAKLLNEIGFINSETVKQAESFFKEKEKVENIRKITKEQAELLMQFKLKYPYNKFITIDELNRICDKYNLIHAPIANYVKDVPEKNLLEIANRKPLNENDRISLIFRLTITDPNNTITGLTADEEKTLRTTGIEIILTKNEARYYHHSLLDKNEILSRVYGKKVKFRWNFSGSQKVGVVDKSGLFIAAPKSHFNLNGLTNKGKFGWFKVTEIEVKDPVVFEYCQGNLCRIITKWGTDDDQSYLDPIVQNENLN